MAAWYLNRFWAFFIAFAISVAVLPPFIAYLRRMKLGQAVREEGPESHLSKSGTPTMGGLVILVAIIVASILMLLLSPITGFDVMSDGGSLLATSLLPIAVLVAFGILGFIDDYPKVTKGRSLGLNMWQKLFAQFAIAIIFLLLLRHFNPQADTSVSFFGKTWVLGWIYWPLATLFIVGMTNAVNLTDGLDGLAAGLSAIAAFALVTATAAAIYLPMYTILAATIGACLGFLWFNTNPARVFMGDTGSLALGGFFAASAIVLKQEIPFLLIGLLFIIEIFTVAVQVTYYKFTRRKYGEGRRIWKMTPLHHHYELSGWPEQKVVVRFWVLGVIFALLGILSRADWQSWIRF